MAPPSSACTQHKLKSSRYGREYPRQIISSLGVMEEKKAPRESQGGGWRPLLLCEGERGIISLLQILRYLDARGCRRFEQAVDFFLSGHLAMICGRIVGIVSVFS